MAPAAIRPATYTLRPGDRIELLVFREAEFSVEDALIDPSGNVNLPLLGEVSAAGASPSALARQVETALGRRYLRDPQVTVRVREASTPTVSVEGQVETPGIYEIRPGYTLLSAIALARSPTVEAKLDEILIFRTVNGQRVGGQFDLARIRAGVDEDPQIVGGDVVVVGYSQLRGAYQDFLRTVPLIGIFTRF